jgi:mannose-6-phosphate isomerase-like protein (cupin superfamily)
MRSLTSPDVEVDVSSAKEFPYVIEMEPKFKPLEVIDEKPLSDANPPGRWWNQTLCEVNDSLVRLAVIEGEYHWHKHENDDEFFYVLEGQLLMDIEGRTIELNPRQGVVVPKGAMHRPRAPKRTVMMMVETKAIVVTGN